MKIRNVLTATAVATLLAAPVASYASTGIFLIGYGAKSRAMGGTGVAYTQDSLSIAYNPANLGDIKRTRLDLGADLFIPPRSVKHDSSLFPADERATTDLFLVPNMAFAQVLNEKMAWGFAMVGAGLQTEFDQTVPNAKAPGSTTYFFNATPNGTNEVGIELMQMQMLPSISYKLNKNHTFGATLAIGLQLFRAEGLGSFGDLGYTQNAEKLTNNGFDISYGAGIRLGWKGRFMNDKLQFGANYSSKVDMSEMDKYAGLFPDKGDFDIPENYAVGVVFEFKEGAHVTFDINQINYRGVKAFRNPGPLADDPARFWPLCTGPSDPTLEECKLGGSKGMGFGWNNQTVYKLGIDYMINNSWIVRGGLAYAKQPIPEDQLLFNLLAPATPERHFTGGATYNWNEDIELNFSIVYAPKVTVEGRTAFGPTQNIVQGTNAAVSMTQLSLGAGLGWKF